MKRLWVISAILVSSMALSAAAHAQGKGYAMRWSQVGGGWSSVLYHTATPKCGHGINAVCQGQNFKGMYNNGQVTTFWIRGCSNPPIQIQCSVTPLH